MAEQQELLPEEGLAQAEAAPVDDMVADAAMAVAPEMAGEVAPPPDGLGDLDQLLSEIDAVQGDQPQAEAPQGNRASMLDEFKRARDQLRQDEEFESQDSITKKFQNIEQELARLKQEKEVLAAQKTRDNINTSINAHVHDALSRLELQGDSGLAKGFSRVVAECAMVAVAKQQARTGSNNIDPAVIGQVVRGYSKIVERLGKEFAARETAKQRRAPAGSTKAPTAPSKDVGDMSENEFEAAVSAAFKALAG